LISSTPASDFEREHERRFLAGLLVILIPLSAIVGILVLPRWLNWVRPLETRTFQAAIGFTLSLLLAFGLNRWGAYRVAALLTVASALVATFWASFDNPDMVLFVLIAVVTATALFRTRRAALVGLAGMAAAPLLLLNPAYGVADIVLPACVNTTLVALLFMVRHHHVRLERQRLDDLLHSERWFSTTLRSIGDAVLTVDTEGLVTFMNPIASALTGWKPDEAEGRGVEEVFDIVNQQSGEPVENPVRKVLREGVVVGLANHTVLIARDGSRYAIADSGAPIVEPSGDLHGVVLVFRDMTQEQALAERLERAQRLESLGQLAGGVAHDFNNLLTVIGSTAEFALGVVGEDSPVRNDLNSLLAATERAVSLTRQLLAFSRRQVMQPRVVRIVEAVNEAQRLLARLLREDVKIVCELDPHTGAVLIDPVQFEQVLVNLAINGGDAMPNGGTLTISTDRIEADLNVGLAPGHYARVRVADTGCGMNEATITRIFEPFFTTKEAGRGTGLGLSTVHGIVRQSRGDISVESQVGVGSTFTVLLPTTDVVEDAAPETPPYESIGRPRAPLTIYLVEDDPMVRALGLRILGPLGYRVLAFGSGLEALAHYDEHPGIVDLLITDVVMPGMNGPRLAEALRARLDKLRVIFISGYADEVVAREGMSEPEGVFIEKPFKPRTLEETVRSLLEGVDST